jgi:hypothetical protein
MTGPHHTKAAKVVALLTLAVVIAIAAGVLYLGPKILSSKDAADLATCRATYAANVNDARWNAVFDLIRSTHRLTRDELDALFVPIDRANRRYRSAIQESRVHPDAFLEHCRR